jgi:hypothetical protein
LLQDKPCGAPPQNLLGTIRMNSTFLEIRDKFFMEKGIWTFFSIFGIPFFVVVLVFATALRLHDWETVPADQQEIVVKVLPFVYLLGLLGIFILWRDRFRKECFRYTHYPIRFNRKTRQVHVFRLDGTVMTEAWEKLYFTRCKNKDNGDWEVRGHRLAADGDTVLETFALGFRGRRNNPEVLAQWEFIRLYMEEGPEKVLPLLENIDIHDIVHRREAFGRGFFVLSAPLGVFAITAAPLSFFFNIGRWLSMRSCKIPEWPAEIEAECVIEPDDSYEVDADRLPSEAKTGLGMAAE